MNLLPPCLNTSLLSPFSAVPAVVDAVDCRKAEGKGNQWR
jgi:hypothetical protein